MNRTATDAPTPPIPAAVAELADRFHRNRAAYRDPRYNETQLRREFIDPLFKALGWDIDNEAGYAEPYKAVVHEDSISIGPDRKAPDYSFRIGGARKFFLEAKKPAIDIRSDPTPAYQLRRYAWSAKLPLSILTNFDHLAVYDTRVKPDKKDRPSTARIALHSFDRYTDPQTWHAIASVFSPEAIRLGSFDKYADSTRRKRGTAEVDDAFLAEIESWRDSLARNIALRNDLNQRQLNHAVQLTIDRTIFLRICEDRGIEDYGELRNLLDGPDTYRRLFDRFRAADARYNSGLFHFQHEAGRPHPDSLTPNLTADDKPLKDILRRLYYPESPYEFSVLSADILGQVYERFLGRVIRLTPSGTRIKVEDKPEVRKAGGVYYTPTYIVDYIVRHTVGNLLEGATVKWVGREKGNAVDQPRLDRPLRVLDPACGSGSFLLGAYQHLLDWHRDFYTRDNPRRWTRRKNPPIYQATDGYRLTVAERKRILTTHIFGVDIDPQAVEVTKLSLLLKVLEGETAQSLGSHLWYARERALPDLSANIRCGNSLIGSDFYDHQQYDIFDDDQRYRINAFDYPTEFPHVFPPSAPGFDAVIGNPPYIRMEAFKPLKDYLRSRYRVHDERSDMYVYFIEREHDLLRDGGIFGMIVSNKFLRANYGRKVRELLAEAATIHRIVDLAGLPVFHGATVRTIVFITSKGRRDTPAIYSPPPDRDAFVTLDGSARLEDLVDPIAYQLSQTTFSGDRWNLIESRSASVIDRLASECVPLSEWLPDPICYGVKSGLVSAFVLDKDTGTQLRASTNKGSDLIKPYVIGRQVRRYEPIVSDTMLIYTHHGVDIDGCDAILDHLRPFKAQLAQRATKQRWYELQQSQQRYVALMTKPKIVYPDIAKHCRFTWDAAGHICGDTTFAIPTEDLLLLGILNSRLALFYFKSRCAALEGATESYLRFKSQYVSTFPIPRSIDTPVAERLRALVQRMLDLQNQLAAAKTAHERNTTQRQLDATDRQIDRLVYELYNLTDEEIRTVEEATK